MSQLFKTKPPAIVLTGIKARLASGAVMGVIGLWSSISNQTIGNYVNGAQNDNQTEGAVFHVNYLPTLASLNSSIDIASIPAVETPQPLRNVSALPTATPAIQSVQIQTVNINSNPQNSANKSSTKKKSSATSRAS